MRLAQLFKFTGYLSLLLLLFGLFCSYWIEKDSANYLFDTADQTPACKTGIVLGTSKHLGNGTENLYFSYRIEAAARLFKAGKVRFLILSGDNRVNDYNEPKSMQNALLAQGVPDSCLVLDYAGLRTFDSMVRCKQVFGQDSVIVVSQQFQNARAVFISKQIGLICFGYNARQVTNQSETKIKVREFFSRIKCVLDFYLLDTKPRHLGEKVRI